MERWLGEVIGTWTGEGHAFTEILLRYRKETLATHLAKHPWLTSILTHVWNMEQAKVHRCACMHTPHA